MWKRDKMPLLGRIFLWLALDDEDLTELSGDFNEAYLYKKKSEGLFKAQAWYWMMLLKSIPSFLCTKIYWRVVMFRSFLKIALRNLFKTKFYSFINIAGLAVGIACCLLIVLYVLHELSYDRHLEYAHRTYRVAVEGRLGDNGFNMASVGSPTGAALVNDYPEVLESTRLMKTGNWFIRYGETTFKETRFVFADPNVFEFFAIPLVKGDPEKVLSEPFSLVISEPMARKYFGNDEPIGKTLNLDNRDDFKVTGVFEEIPSNRHFHYDFFASLITVAPRIPDIWLSMNLNTYILLQEGADPDELEAKFPEMVRKYCGPEFERFLGKSFEELGGTGNSLKYYLQPLTKIHLHSDLEGELEPNSDIRYVYIFSAIAFFILVIACINFMNLSTARSANRAREVGIRKVVGSLRSQLVRQFLTESVVLGILALAVAVLLVAVVLPHFNNLAGKELSLSALTQPMFIVSLLAIIVFVGFIEGCYPSLFLSSFRPVTVLRQKFGSGRKGRFIRQILVVFQFTTSIVLIVGTLVVFKQLHYVQNRKLGFDREHVLVLHDAFILQSQVESFKNALLQRPEIVSATVSGYLPVTSDRLVTTVFPEGKRVQGTSTPIQAWRVDFDYIKTLGMEIVKGRDFSRSFLTDSTAVIINEAASKHFGWEDPIGNSIGLYVAMNPPTVATFTVIGVVKDFHYESLRDQIRPLALFRDESTSLISLRLKASDLSGTIAFIEETWNTFAPGQPFEYSFLDDRFDTMYRAEQRIGRIFGIFATLAVFVGCLGLFGLSAFTTEQRTKEIGVRKVLGAPVLGIVTMLSKEFSRLVVVSLVIAVPAAYMIMNGWLREFAYRASIGVWPFIASGLLALAIAWLTVSYHAVKIARSNPVKSLRYE